MISFLNHFGGTDFSQQLHWNSSTYYRMAFNPSQEVCCAAWFFVTAWARTNSDNKNQAPGTWHSSVHQLYQLQYIGSLHHALAGTRCQEHELQYRPTKLPFASHWQHHSSFSIRLANLLRTFSLQFLIKTAHFLYLPWFDSVLTKPPAPSLILEMGR